ncbi:hypothetical protein JCM11641_005729 [Rhodosporidiobolus odoratus]
MLALEPHFLPLQPLPEVESLDRFRIAAGPTLGNPSDLPSTCSISAIRQSFHPFPVRRAAQQRLSFVASHGDRVAGGTPEDFLRELALRPMQRRDVERVKQLQDDCLPASFPPSFYTLLLTNPSSLCLIANSPASPSTILGCISASISSTVSSLSRSTSQSNTIHIYALAVAPSARKQGLASHLLHAISERLVPRAPISTVKRTVMVKLHVAVENERARGLYRKVGFVEKARKRGYYRKGSGEAIEMEGRLTV